MLKWKTQAHMLFVHCYGAVSGIVYIKYKYEDT